MTYEQSLVWDSYKGMFVKHPLFWCYTPYAIFAQYVHDETLFRGVRY